MRLPIHGRVTTGLIGWLAFASTASLAQPPAAEVAASAPTALSVTLYRNPDRSSGSIRLSALRGFALVTETRQVSLPIGESRLRFEGVVDGIETDTAILHGLPQGVIEKNRNAALLSPEALVQASLDADVTLVRRRFKTGDLQKTSATIRSATPDEIVFQTLEGVEALKCSGLSETLAYERVPAGLTTVPTLSVLTRTDHAATVTVTLSYLASGFDWAANYVATLAAGGRTLNLGGWITLANANSVGLADASVQVVAGRLNRGRGASDAAAIPRVIARCWPAGTTSDHGNEPILVTAIRRDKSALFPSAMRAMALPAPAPPEPPEALGDLKLYRLPQPITIAGRQSKQIRFLDQSDVGFSRILTADLPMRGETRQAAALLLRTQNARSKNLGLLLPAGRVTVMRPEGPGALLVGEAPIADTAVDQTVELQLGSAPTVMITQSRSPGGSGETVVITNDGPQQEIFELRLRPLGSVHIVKPDHGVAMKDGRPIFRLELPANGAVTLHYDVAPG